MATARATFGVRYKIPLLYLLGFLVVVFITKARQDVKTIRPANLPVPMSKLAT